jgi:hypothetical protein
MSDKFKKNKLEVTDDSKDEGEDSTSSAGYNDEVILDSIKNSLIVINKI